MTVNQVNQVKLTGRHEHAVHNIHVGLPVSHRILATLRAAGLVRPGVGEPALTEKGCDMAATRLRIKHGKIVKA